MKHPHLIFEMEVKLTYGRKLKFQVKSWEHVENCATKNESGAAVAQTVCAAPRKRLSENASGAKRATVAPKRRDRGAFSLQEAFSAQESAEPKQKKEIKEELEQAKDALRYFSSKLADIDHELVPYWHEYGELKSDILFTHGKTDAGTVVINLANAQRRKTLFEAMDRLAVDWGPVKKHRNQILAQIKTIEKQVRDFEHAISKEEKRKAKHAKRS